MAVAKACSLDSDDCVDIGAIEAVAQQYANSNARDGVTHLKEICGRLPGILQPCTDPASNLTACLGGPDSPPPAPARYVEVRVHTEMRNGAFALPPAFAQAMAGDETFDGTQVGACARASWEPAEEVTVLAMTISTCEFDTATNSGTDFAAPPPYPPNPSPSDEYTIAFPTPADPDQGAFGLRAEPARTAMGPTGTGRLARRQRELRDEPTEDLEADEVASAAIESAAENLVDSVAAPVLAYAAGGLPAAWAYRAVNTADAMWGYRDARYERFGKAAARLDDLANLVPARLGAAALVAGAALAGEDGGRRPRRVGPARRTASPNAGWPMAAMAGALQRRAREARCVPTR